MFRIFLLARSAVVMLVGVGVFAAPRIAMAQHGGGGGHGAMGGAGGGAGRPDGVSDRDDLKDFHRAVALQANDEQRAAFGKVAHYSEAASAELQAFRKLLATPSSPAVTDRATELDQAIAKARAANQNFIASFTAPQKTGLKEITNKLARLDSELDRQTKAFRQAIPLLKADNEQIGNSVTALEKTVSSFQNEQLALGTEMGILVDSSGQTLSFNLPQLTNSISVGGKTVSIPTSGLVSRTSIENGENIFSIKLAADLSDLQQNVSSMVRSELSHSPQCGERIEVLQATLTAAPPSSLVVTNLHFERWTCPPGQSPMEIADGEATVEIKITAQVATDKNADNEGELKLVSEINHVDADRLLLDMLRSGNLGTTLRQQITDLVLAFVQKAADLRNLLPSMARRSARLESAEFQDMGAGQLGLILYGRMQFSDEQTKQFAEQLKQTPAPQSAAAH